MDLNLLLIPGVAFGRALLGWAENSFKDKKIDLPEWQRLGETVVRMGVPMAALVFGLSVDPVVAVGLITILDVVIVKLYNALKK